MGGGAQLSVTDLRRAARHPVEYRVIGEHRQQGDVLMHVINISANGFMTSGQLDLARGERVTIRLPGVGRIEAFVIWNNAERAGFQFERILRLEDFMKTIDALQPNPKLRASR